MSHPLTHPRTHAPTHPRTHSLTHSLTHSPTRPLTHSPTHPLTHSPTHSLTHSPTHPLSHSLTHSLTHPLTHPLTRPLRALACAVPGADLCPHLGPIRGRVHSYPVATVSTGVTAGCRIYSPISNCAYHCGLQDAFSNLQLRIPPRTNTGVRPIIRGPNESMPDQQLLYLGLATLDGCSPDEAGRPKAARELLYSHWSCWTYSAGLL